MKKLLVALLFLLAPAAFAGPYTLTVHNYTNKTFHWHQDAVTFGNKTIQSFDITAVAATEEFVTPSTVVINLPDLSNTSGIIPIGFSILDESNQISFSCSYDSQSQVSMHCKSSNYSRSVPGPWNSSEPVDNTRFSRFTSPRLSFLDPVMSSDGKSAQLELSIYPSIIEEQERNQKVLDALNKTINSKLDALNTTIDSSVKNEVQHTAVVQTSVNNYLTTSSGNQTNLVNAVSTAMQSARDAAALDTKDYGVNNFYPSMTKQSADGKYLVYPAQSFTLSGGCTLNAAPNNYLTVAHDANQEKNATQLLTAMVLGRRVEITQHQKDLETTDCGVIDSVKILDK